MSITYPAHSLAAAKLALLLTTYHNTYSNSMLTDYMSAMTIHQFNHYIFYSNKILKDIYKIQKEITFQIMKAAMHRVIK